MQQQYVPRVLTLRENTESFDCPPGMKVYVLYEGKVDAKKALVELPAGQFPLSFKRIRRACARLAAEALDSREDAYGRSEPLRKHLFTMTLADAIACIMTADGSGERPSVIVTEYQTSTSTPKVKRLKQSWVVMVADQWPYDSGALDQAFRRGTRKRSTSPSFFVSSDARTVGYVLTIKGVQLPPNLVAPVHDGNWMWVVVSSDWAWRMQSPGVLSPPPSRVHMLLYRSGVLWTDEVLCTGTDDGSSTDASPSVWLVDIVAPVLRAPTISDPAHPSDDWLDDISWIPRVDVHCVENCVESSKTILNHLLGNEDVWKATPHSRILKRLASSLRPLAAHIQEVHASADEPTRSQICEFAIRHGTQWWGCFVPLGEQVFLRSLPADLLHRSLWEDAGGQGALHHSHASSEQLNHWKLDGALDPSICIVVHGHVRGVRWSGDVVVVAVDAFHDLVAVVHALRSSADPEVTTADTIVLPMSATFVGDDPFLIGQRDACVPQQYSMVAPGSKDECDRLTLRRQDATLEALPLGGDSVASLDALEVFLPRDVEQTPDGVRLGDGVAMERVRGIPPGAALLSVVRTVLPNLSHYLLGHASDLVLPCLRNVQLRRVLDARSSWGLQALDDGSNLCRVALALLLVVLLHGLLGLDARLVVLRNVGAWVVCRHPLYDKCIVVDPAQSTRNAFAVAACEIVPRPPASKMASTSVTIRKGTLLDLRHGKSGRWVCTRVLGTSNIQGRQFAKLHFERTGGVDKVDLSSLEYRVRQISDDTDATALLEKYLPPLSNA
jgi:hypothetical protein